MYYKRFLLFCFDTYYPLGGISDLRGDYDTMDEAQEAWQSTKSSWDWGEIVDLETGERIDP